MDFFFFNKPFQTSDDHLTEMLMGHELFCLEQQRLGSIISNIFLRPHLQENGTSHDGTIGPSPNPHVQKEGWEHLKLDQVGNESSTTRFLNKFCGPTQGTTMPKHMDSTQTRGPLDFHDLDTFESVNCITIWTS